MALHCRRKSPKVPIEKTLYTNFLTRTLKIDGIRYPPPYTKLEHIRFELFLKALDDPEQADKLFIIPWTWAYMLYPEVRERCRYYRMGVYAFDNLTFRGDTNPQHIARVNMDDYEW